MSLLSSFFSLTKAKKFDFNSLSCLHYASAFQLVVNAKSAILRVMTVLSLRSFSVNSDHNVLIEGTSKTKKCAVRIKRLRVSCSESDNSPQQRGHRRSPLRRGNLGRVLLTLISALI